MRIAINGMGRIGRLLFTRLLKDPRHEVVAINDVMSPDNLAYLIKYDSVSGPYPGDVDVDGNLLTCDGHRVQALTIEDPLQCPWKELSVDIVVECTGKFVMLRDVERHLKAGARKVLLATTGTPDIPLIIRGFNDHALGDEKVISPGGCMTNCLTIALKVILEQLSVESVHVSVLHAYTTRQLLHDGPYKNVRRGRAASLSIIPVSVDLADALVRLFPKLTNRIKASSIRVPIPRGALADVCIQLDHPVTIEQVNRLYKEAADSLKGVLHYNNDEIVSHDVIGNTHSCVYDETLTSIAGRQLKLGFWFDNEAGLTQRLVEIVGLMGGNRT